MCCVKPHSQNWIHFSVVPFTLCSHSVWTEPEAEAEPHKCEMRFADSTFCLLVRITKPHLTSVQVFRFRRKRVPGIQNFLGNSELYCLDICFRQCGVWICAGFCIVKTGDFYLCWFDWWKRNSRIRIARVWLYWHFMSSMKVSKIHN